MALTLKVAICFPRFGDVRGPFAKCLARLVAFTLSAKVDRADGPVKFEIEIFDSDGSDLPANRSELFHAAIAWDANYLLWVDTDMTFPPDAMLRLMVPGLPVVGCNYPQRLNPDVPAASKLNAAGEMVKVPTSAEIAAEAPLELVAHTGLGFCLMDMAVLPTLKAHIDKTVGWDKWQPFDRRRLPGRLERIGEDTSFLHTLGEAGIPVYVHHGVSMDLGHIAETVLTFPR